MRRARFRRSAAQDRRAVRDERGARALRAKFRYVMVDEYQDTNRPQYMLIRRLAAIHRNLASSAIPTSRSTSGAAPTCATSSTSRRTSPDAKIVKLEQNYRSTQVILDAASAVIQQNRNRKDKRLWTDRKGGATDPLLPRRRRDRRSGLHRRSRSSRRARKTSTAWSRCSTAPTRSRARLKTR